MPSDIIAMHQKRVTFLLKTLTDYTLSTRIPEYRKALDKRCSSGEKLTQYEGLYDKLKAMLEEQADSVYDLSLLDLTKAEAQLKETLIHTGYLEGKADFLDDLDSRLNMPVITTAAEKALRYNLQSNIERAVGYAYPNIGRTVFAELGNPAVLIGGAALVLLLTIYGGEIAEAVLLVLTLAGVKSNLDGIFAGIKSLIKFFQICAKAKTEEELKEAGNCFSDAAVKLSINGIFLVLACGGMKAKAETNGFEFLKPQFTREFNKNKIGAGQRVYESALAPRNVQKEAREILTDAGYKNEKVLTDEDTINQLNALRKTYSDDELAEVIKIKRAQGKGLKKILENLNEQPPRISQYSGGKLYYLKNISMEEAEKLLSGKLKTKAISSTQIANALKKNAPAPKLFVRISFSQYSTLTNKQYAFVCDPKEIAGLSNIEIIKRLGFDEASIRLAMQLESEGKLKLHATLIELPKGVTAVKPTWDKLHIDVLDAINNDEEFMDSFRALNIVTENDTVDMAKFDKMFNAIEHADQGQQYVNALPADVKIFRGLIERRFGTNPLFRGDGKTVSIDNEFGFREFVVDQPQYGWDIELLRKHGYTIKDLILTDEEK